MHGKGSFSCDKCFITFNRKNIFLRHERTCSIICKYSDTEFDSGSDSSIHVQSEHSDQKYCCSKCAKKYIEKRDLKKHQQTSANTISNEDPNSSYPTLRPIINHIQNGVKDIHHYNFHYTCVEFVYINIKLLKLHLIYIFINKTNQSSMNSYEYLYILKISSWFLYKTENALHVLRKSSYYYYFKKIWNIWKKKWTLIYFRRTFKHLSWFYSSFTRMCLIYKH